MFFSREEGNEGIVKKRALFSLGLSLVIPKLFPIVFSKSFNVYSILVLFTAYILSRFSEIKGTYNNLRFHFSVSLKLTYFHIFIMI